MTVYVLCMTALRASRLDWGTLRTGFNTFGQWHNKYCLMQLQQTRLFSCISGSDTLQFNTYLFFLALVEIANKEDIRFMWCMLKGKKTHSSFLISNNTASDLLDLIHCDLWGPYPKASFSGSNYFLTIVDDKSRVVWVYLLIDKSATSGCLKNFTAMVKTQFGKDVNFFWSDNGTEFVNTRLKEFYANHRILMQTSYVRTPQQNGRVERKHRNILEVARALRLQAYFPIEFGGDVSKQRWT